MTWTCLPYFLVAIHAVVGVLPFFHYHVHKPELKWANRTVRIKESDCLSDCVYTVIIIIIIIMYEYVIYSVANK